MAAIARFVSYDGGIAFSESSLKIQKRDEAQGRIIPVAEIASMEVFEPLCGDDGNIRFRLIGERQPSNANALFFDEEQYEEAVRFKVAFDTLKSRSLTAPTPLEIFPPSTPPRMARPSTALRPAGEQRPVRQRPPQGNTRTGRFERQKPKRGGRVKKILIGVAGGYAALLAIGGIALLFDNTPKDDMVAEHTPTVISDSWSAPAARQESLSAAPDASAFLEQAKAAAGGQAGEGVQIKDVTLAAGNLLISVDYTDPSYLNSYDDDLLLANSDRIVGPILALGDQYDPLWDSMTVDYGAYGKVVKNKSDIVSLPDENGGVSSQRYFAPPNETVVHDVPLPQAQQSASSSESVGASGAAAVSQGGGESRFVGYTSPPAVTDPPVTAPPEKQSEPLVWIPTKGGKKYHKTSTCSGMNGPIQVTVSEAESKGFTPCKKCY